MRGAPLDRPEIRISIETREPVAGGASLGTGEALPFQGWLDLLRVLSELLTQSAAPGPGPASSGG